MRTICTKLPYEVHTPFHFEAVDLKQNLHGQQQLATARHLVLAENTVSDIRYILVLYTTIGM